MTVLRKTKENRTILSKQISDRSLGTQATEETSLGSSLHSTSPVRRRVRFFENGESDEDIKRSVTIIHRFEDPTLWWPKQEIKSMRAASLLLAYNNRDYQDGFLETTLSYYESNSKERLSRQLMEHMSLHPDLRGLEHFFVPQLERLSKDQIIKVLEKQRENRDPKAIRKAALEGSRAAKKLARQRACHDTKEALKCSFTSWKK